MMNRFLCETTVLDSPADGRQPAVRLEVRAALAAAEAIIAVHTVYGNGLCSCLRRLPCPAVIQAELYAQHWRTRIDYFTAIAGPTMLLGQV